jgi:hypothetical protein
MSSWIGFGVGERIAFVLRLYLGSSPKIGTQSDVDPEVKARRKVQRLRYRHAAPSAKGWQVNLRTMTKVKDCVAAAEGGEIGSDKKREAG